MFSRSRQHLIINNRSQFGESAFNLLPLAKMAIKTDWHYWIPVECSDWRARCLFAHYIMYPHNTKYRLPFNERPRTAANKWANITANRHLEVNHLNTHTHAHTHWSGPAPAVRPSHLPIKFPYVRMYTIQSLRLFNTAIKWMPPVCRIDLLNGPSLEFLLVHPQFQIGS